MSRVKGWPEGWTARRVHAWEARGGTNAAARAFAVAGCGARELLEAVEGLDDVRELAPPALELVRLLTALGFGWTDILAGDLPPLDPAGSLACRVLTPARGERVWQISRQDRGAEVVEYQRQGKGPWSRQRRDASEDDPLECLRGDSALTLVSSDAITRYACGRTDPGPSAVVALLAVADGPHPHLDAWEEGDGDAWADDDEFLTDVLPGLPLEPVWCSVGEQRLARVRLPWDKNQTRLVAVDLDEERLTAGNDLVEFSWHSESAGAPVSWDGGARLALLAPDLAYSEETGDQGDERALLPWPDDLEAQAEVVATWIVDVGAAVLAALDLEPWTLDGLPVEERERWAELLDVDASLHLQLPPPLLDSVRARLRHEQPYARMRQALADPQGDDGRALIGVLDELERRGVLGPLLHDSASW